MKMSVILLLTHSFLLLFCSTVRAHSVENKFSSTEQLALYTSDTVESSTIRPDTLLKTQVNIMHLKTAQGSLRFSLSLPYVNLFNFQFPDEAFKAVGFLGAKAGIDFFYKDNHYISLNAGGATSAGLPNKKNYGYDTTASIFYVNLKNNLILGKFSLGYGLNASQIEWHNKIVTDSINLNQSIRNTLLGLSFSAQYCLGKSFYFDASYQPDFFILNPSSKFKYQHYISFGFVYKLTLKTRKQQPLNKQINRKKVYIFY